MSNFQLHSFLYTWTFMFHHFGLKLLFWGQNLTFCGYIGSHVKIKYFNPKGHILAWFRAFWAIMRQNRSKGLISARASEKVTRKWHFTYLTRSLRERIFTKLGTNVPLVTNFVTIYSRDKILQEVKVPNFPIGDVTVITVLRFRDCDIRVKLHKSRQITAFGKMKLFTLIAE